MDKLRREAWRWGVMDISREDAEGMSDRAVFRASVLDNINRTIKDITGAAMTDAEAKRIIPTQPNLEVSGPEFTALLDEVEGKVADFRDRRLYMLSRGLIGDAHDFRSEGAPISLQAFLDRKNARGKALAQQLRAQNPDASDEQIREAVFQQLDAELQSGADW